MLFSFIQNLVFWIVLYYKLLFNKRLSNFAMKLNRGYRWGTDQNKNKIDDL